MLHKILAILVTLPYTLQDGGYQKRIYIAHGSSFVKIASDDKLELGSSADKQEFRIMNDNTMQSSSHSGCVWYSGGNSHAGLDTCSPGKSFTYDSQKQTYVTQDNRCWKPTSGSKIKIVACTNSAAYGFIEEVISANSEPAGVAWSSMSSVPPQYITATTSAPLLYVYSSTVASEVISANSEPAGVAWSSMSSVPPQYIAATTSAPLLYVYSSTVASVNKTNLNHANDLYLASPGEQCQDFCQKRGLFCSTSIATGNTDTAFSYEGVTCKDSETHKFWRYAYDPSYRVNGSVCAGYMNLNESGIKCSVIGFNDTNIRRLCKCLISADEDKFTPWTPWSSCSLSCNGGIQTRTRACNELSCTGPTTDTGRCNTQPCPIHGGFSDWSSWSSCTVTCGGGQRSQNRTCTNPMPDHGGLDCFGDKERTDKCNSEYCPVHGAWTEWTQWSACDKPCNDGRIKRWRYCTKPAPLYGGNTCSGQSIEEIQCNTRKCPAENITVVEVRFEYHWNDSMQTKDSLPFNEFATDLETNVGRIFQYSVVNSSYQRAAVNTLRKGSVISSFTLYFTGLDSFQTLLLQEAIENDKYIGKMKILGFNNTYKTAIVPAWAPLNFTLTPLSPTSIRAEWLEIPPSHQNGNVSGYILFYKEKLLRTQPYMSIATNKLNVSLQGLKIYTEYTFRVLAYNENGNGIATEETQVYTMESVPAIPPYNVTAKSPTGFTAVIEWIHISQYDWNGVPVGTLVKFNDENGHAGNVTIDFPTSSATIIELIPSTTYLIDVCEVTSPGSGPCQRLQVTTNPSPPSRSPENITIEEKTSHSQLGLSWNSIVPTYVHGDLLGYKVLYTLTKVAGNAIVAQTTKMKTVHPSLTTVIITGLEANAQYSFQLLAFNAYGDGVSSATYYGETCACPPIIHTNYAASAPYMYRDSSGKRQGLLVDILENATRYVCNACRRPTATIIDYVNNGKNGWAEKGSLAEVKRDIDNYIEITFPAFGSTELTTYYGFPFTPVFSHPGVVYYIIKDSMNDQVVKMMENVFNTWPIFLINFLLLTMSGYIVWATEYKIDQSDFSDKCLPGVLSGMYWAFISMGTHGYGDLTPRGIASRIFAIIWILVGMVNLAIFTGALTTAITAAQVYNDPKMYGVEVAAVHDSAAYRIAILRNAKVNTKASYKTIEDVSSALKQRQVRGALVDVFSAASRSDLFLQSDIVAKKSLEYPSAYGFVLSGDMKNAAPDFRSYLNSQADKILAFMKEKSAGLEVNTESGETVSMFDPSSPILARVLVAVSVSFAILFFAGICYHFYMAKRKREAVNPSKVQVGIDIMELCENSLSQLEESISERITAKFNDQLKERVNFLYKCKSPTILKWIPYFRLKKSPHQKVLFIQVTPGPSNTAMDSNETHDR